MPYTDDLAFAACALWLRYLSADRLVQRLDEKRLELDAGIDRPLGVILAGHGDLSEAQLTTSKDLVALVERLRLDSFYGRAALRNRLATARQLNEALERQQSLGYNQRIGALLVELGHIDKARDPVLQSVQRRVARKEDAQLEEHARTDLQWDNLDHSARHQVLKKLVSPFVAWLKAIDLDMLQAFSEKERLARDAHEQKQRETARQQQLQREQHQTQQRERLAREQQLREQQKQQAMLREQQTSAEPVPPPFEANSNAPIDANGRTIQIPGYEMVACLGSGAMGDVYKYLQKSLDRHVAIKILNEGFDETEEFLARFMREAQAAAALNHPNIVQAYDVGTVRGVHFFVMEFVEGIPLRQMIEEFGPVPEKKCLDMALQIVRGLEHAHQRGIIHRDIKPANLMLSRSGELKICDFGLAKRTTDDAGLTKSNVALGTPHYMSPEQCRNEPGITTRSDIYSLGASLYHLATANVPYDSDSSLSVMLMHCNDPFPDPRERFIGLDLSDAFVKLIRRMMEKDPERRWDDPSVLAEAVLRVRAGKDPSPSKPRVRKRGLRRASNRRFRG